MQISTAEYKPSIRVNEAGNDRYRFSLAERLQSALGINLVVDPHLAPQPARWLVRGDTHRTDRLSGRQLEFPTPPGKDWTSGVFMADNARHVSAEPFFVFDRDDVYAGPWLTCNSPEMEHLIAEFARENTPQIDLSTYAGYYQAAARVYREKYVYNSSDGTCTSPNPIAVELASAIVLSEGFYKTIKDDIAPVLRDKIVVL